MAFAIGVDLGRDADYSTIAVVRDGAQDQLYVVHLHRFELGTSYPKVVNGVMEIFSDPRLENDGRLPVLAVDETGVGGAVTDLLLERGAAFHSVTITSAKLGKSYVHDVEAGRVRWRVPKAELIEALERPFRTGKLKVAKGLRWSPALMQELTMFRRKINPRTAHVSYEHGKATEHDDLVLGTALACWGACL